jgi:hypothetical protein
VLRFGHANMMMLDHELVDCGRIRAEPRSFGRPGTPAGEVAVAGSRSSAVAGLASAAVFLHLVGAGFTPAPGCVPTQDIFPA